MSLMALTLDQAELIKRKIERLAKENREDELDLVLVLLSNEGHVPKSGFDVSFQHYIARYSADTFEKVKLRLIEEEALLRETSERLELNHYQAYQLSSECSRLVFEIRKEEYLSRLSTITAEPEGEYILSSLASYYYASISEDKMTQLEREVGRSHFTKLIDDLENAGILFRYAYQNQPVYWRLFPPIKELYAVKEERDKEALTYIYITQEVRPEGVLQSDCSQWKDVITRLIFLGLVGENRWYSHQLYLVTEKGAKVARPIIRDRLYKNQAEVEKLLESAPRKLIRFLLKEVFLSYGYYTAMPRAHPEVLPTHYIWCDLKHDEHRCLLRDPKVRDWRNQILAKLKEIGLCYLAHSYVSTRGGEVRELNYCLPPEVDEFFTYYLKKKGDEDVFTLDIESFHRAYHFLDSFSPEMDMSRVVYLMNLYKIGKEQGDKILDELIEQNMIEKTAEGFRVKDSLLLKELAERKFQTIVNYLLERVVEPKIPSTPPPPKPSSKPSPVKLVTPQPMQEGQISILLGYRVDEESSVFWQPTNEKNPHILVVGTTGSGKTETLRALVHELKKLKITSLILDFHDEYSPVSELTINIRKGITINPLELLERSPLDTRFEVSNILREIYGLGDQQEAYLRKAIKSAYESKGIYEKESATWVNTPPNFSDVKTFLEEMMEESSQSRSVVTTLLNRLEPIFDIEVFSGSTTISFDQIVGKTTAIQLKDLPTEEVKTAVSDFFLRRLWYYMYKLGQSKELRFYCIIDEGHRLAYEKSPLDQFLREARKYGVGVMLSSQRPSDFSETVVANVATLVCLQCPFENDAKFMAKQLNCNPQDVQFLEEVGKSIIKFSSTKEPLNVQIIPLFQRT